MTSALMIIGLGVGLGVILGISISKFLLIVDEIRERLRDKQRTSTR